MGRGCGEVSGVLEAAQQGVTVPVALCTPHPMSLQDRGLEYAEKTRKAEAASRTDAGRRVCRAAQVQLRYPIVEQHGVAHRGGGGVHLEEPALVVSKLHGLRSVARAKKKRKRKRKTE